MRLLNLLIALSAAAALTRTAIGDEITPAAGQIPFDVNVPAGVLQFGPDLVMAIGGHFALNPHADPAQQNQRSSPSHRLRPN